MASLFADENFPTPVTRRLRKLGHDVLTCGDVDITNRRIPDDIVLEFASRLERAVLTVNRDDFVALHDRGAAHAGIIAWDAASDFDALAYRVHRAIIAEASLSGRLVEVTMR